MGIDQYEHGGGGGGGGGMFLKNTTFSLDM